MSTSSIAMPINIWVIVNRSGPQEVHDSFDEAAKRASADEQIFTYTADLVTEQEKRGLERKLAEEHARAEKLERELDEWKARCAELDHALNEGHEGCSNDLTAERAKVAELEKRVEQLQSALDTQQELHHHFNAQCVELERKIAEKDVQILDLRHKLEESQAYATGLRNTLDHWRDGWKDKAKELAQAHAEVARFKDALEKARKWWAEDNDAKRLRELLAHEMEISLRRHFALAIALNALERVIDAAFTSDSKPQLEALGAARLAAETAKESVRQIAAKKAEFAASKDGEK